MNAKIRTALVLVMACGLVSSLQAALITEGQWLQLNFADAVVTNATANFNTYNTVNSGFNLATGNDTQMVDSLGNLVDATLSANGWQNSGGNVNDAWGGMGSDVPAPGTATWEKEQINNFWWDITNPGDATMTIGGLDANLTYNIYYYSKLDQALSLEAHSVTINGNTQNTLGRGARFADTDEDLFFPEVVTDGSGNLNISWGNVTGTNPFVTAIVVEAIPEPATLGLLAAAGGALLIVRRNSRLMM